MSFDVLAEPWIPVRDQEGIHDVSVLQALEHATEYLEISDVSPQYEFGIYRMLFAFLMDAYRPSRQWDIEDILETGSFDMKKISDYIAECNKEGKRFDLFDAEHPFLQVPLNEWEKKETVPVVNMINFQPSGNNHIHFDHTIDREGEIDYKEAAKLLCSISLFCTPGAQEYPSTVNGTPPTYCVVKGKNLFETLVYGMVPASICENYANPPAIWHSNQKVEAKKLVASSSLLYLLTFPCRRVTLEAETDNKVRKIHFGQGMNFVGYESFKDPYVSYRYSEKGVSSLKPQLEKAAWRNIATIMDCSDTATASAPFTLKQFRKLTNTSKVVVDLFEVVTNKAAYYEEQKGSLVVARRILDSEIRFKTMKNAVSRVEEISEMLEYGCKCLAKKLNRDGLDASMLAQCQEAKKRFFAAARDDFFSVLLEQLDNEKPDYKVIAEEWNHKMIIWCMREYERFADTVCNNSYMLICAVEARQDLMRSLYRKSDKNDETGRKRKAGGKKSELEEKN